MTRLTNEISVLKFVRADRSSEFDGLLAQIDPRGPSRARGSCYDGSTTRRTGDQRRCRNVKRIYKREHFGACVWLCHFRKTTSKEASLRRATFFFKLIPGHSKKNPHADKKSPSAYRIQLFPSNAILCISITSANLLL